MNRQQKGIRSTKDKIKDALENIETERCMNPPEERERMNQIFMTLGYVDKKEGTIYADLKGELPITSIHGMAAMFIMYDWTSNTILATPIKKAKAETIVECLKRTSHICQRENPSQYTISLTM